MTDSPAESAAVESRRTTALGGITPAVLTVFTSTGDLDVDRTLALADRLLEEGAEGLVLAGTSGEFIGLTSGEREGLVRETVSAVAGRVPVIAGTGSYSTRETIELTDAAMAAGASAALVILPYYQRPHHVEVMEHFREVHRATRAPILVYNNPTNSGTAELSGDDLGALEADGAAIGVKSTFPTVHQTYEAIVATSPEFVTFHGGFNAPLEGLAAGASGWISGILNVSLPDSLAMRDAVVKGDLATAQEIWRTKVLPLRFLYTKAQLGPLNDLQLYRSILRLRGFDAGSSRRPLLPLTPEQEKRLAALLELAGLL